MLLIAGLGNPGERYKRNRHNAGFLICDVIAKRHGFSPWRSRFQGQASEGHIGGEKALLLKPETFMNESGLSVGAALRFLKLPLGDLVVVHDELDLPPAKARLKTGGGNAGHNGLRSITAHCGNDYRRLRIGIGHPGDKAAVHNYVLNDFGKDELNWLADLAEAVSDQAALLAKGEDAAFQSKLHLAMEAKGWGDVKRAGEG